MKTIILVVVASVVVFVIWFAGIRPKLEQSKTNQVTGTLAFDDGFDTILIGRGPDTLFYGCPVCLQRENDSLRRQLSAMSRELWDAGLLVGYYEVVADSLRRVIAEICDTCYYMTPVGHIMDTVIDGTKFTWDPVSGTYQSVVEYDTSNFVGAP